MAPGGVPLDTHSNELLVAGVRAGDPAAVTALYHRFQPGVRFLIARALRPDDVEDQVHNVLLAVIEAIKGGVLREPGRLAAYIRGVARNVIRVEITHAVRDRARFAQAEAVELIDGRLSPEEQASLNERVELAKSVLLRFPPLDREIVTRFYLRGESKEQICGELGLTSTQFRLRKSATKCQITEAISSVLRTRRP